MKRKKATLIIKRFWMTLLTIAIVLTSVAETKQIAFAAEDEIGTEELNTEDTGNNEDAGSGEENVGEIKEEVNVESSEEEKEEAAEEEKEEAAEEIKEVTEETTSDENAETEENTDNTENTVSGPAEPTKPEIEGEVNNDKINLYNLSVDDYNSKVDEYNKAVDAQYEAEVADVARQNEEIEKHNQQEQQKVLEAERQNEELKAKYDEDYAQYEKDQETADYVVSRYNGRFANIEEYNNWVVRDYNNPAEKSAEENAKDSNAFNVSDTYAIEEAEEKSGKDVVVRILHSFMGLGDFSEEVVMDENDTITLYSAAAHLQTTAPGYAQFYMKSDDAHAMGYWYSAGTMLMETANISEYGWDCGAKHTVSYREGKLHPGDSTDVDIVNYYNWRPLKTYGLYNVPNKPVLNLVEYTPDIREKLATPTKKNYLSYLAHMDLLAEPVIEEPEVEPTPEPTPVVEEPVVEEPTVEEPEVADPVIIDEPVIPLAPQPEEAPAVDTTNDEPYVAPYVEPYIAPAPVVIAEAPVALAEVLAPEAQVLGATREEAPAAAVLGARRGTTEDTNNSMARIILMIIAGGAAITVLFTRKIKA